MRDTSFPSNVVWMELAKGLHRSNASPSVNTSDPKMYSCVNAKKRFVFRNPGFAGGDGGGGGRDGSGGGLGEANSLPGTNDIFLVKPFIHFLRVQRMRNVGQWSSLSHTCRSLLLLAHVV